MCEFRGLPVCTEKYLAIFLKKKIRTDVPKSKTNPHFDYMRNGGRIMIFAYAALRKLTFTLDTYAFLHQSCLHPSLSWTGWATPVLDFEGGNDYPLKFKTTSWIELKYDYGPLWTNGRSCQSLYAHMWVPSLYLVSHSTPRQRWGRRSLPHFSINFSFRCQPGTKLDSIQKVTGVTDPVASTAA